MKRSGYPAKWDENISLKGLVLVASNLVKVGGGHPLTNLTTDVIVDSQSKTDTTEALNCSN